MNLTATDVDGTPLRLQRHRLFESNVWIWQRECRHDPAAQVGGVYGGGQRSRAGARIRRGGYCPSKAVAETAMGISWMNLRELAQAIPPAYTELIGGLLLDHLHTLKGPRMSDTVKLSAAMPADTDTNGVDALAATLVDDPEQIHVAVLWFDTVKITDLTDSGRRIPTIRVRRVEPIGNVADVPAAIRDLVDAATEKRTGRAPLPFDEVEVVDTDFVHAEIVDA